MSRAGSETTTDSWSPFERTLVSAIEVEGTPELVIDNVVESESLCNSDGDHSLVDRLVVDDCSTLPNTKLSLPTTPTSEATSDCIVGPASSSASVGCAIDVAPIMDPAAIKPFKAMELGASILE